MCRTYYWYATNLTALLTVPWFVPRPSVMGSGSAAVLHIGIWQALNVDKRLPSHSTPFHHPLTMFSYDNYIKSLTLNKFLFGSLSIER